MLKVEGLAKDYNVLDERKRVLEGISFTANDGEILGITGKSGSGKSTLLRILRGVESFDEGVIELEGKQFFPDSDKDDIKDLMQKTAIHLQRNFGLWNGPAIENIIRRVNSRREGHEGLPESDSPFYDEIYEESMEYLKVVGLEHKALHVTSALSGGEKQRLILARQLAAKPKLLLLDEPVTMTGPGTKQEVLDVIKKVKKELNIPIIVVSHLPELHMYIADRLIYLEDGHIIEEGKTEAVLKHFLKDMQPQVEITPLEKRETVIKIKDINKRLALIRVGEVLNFKGLSLDIHRGEIVSLIGQSGAGKTTLLKMIEGLISPTSGEILYLHDGEWLDITHFNSRRMELRKKISIMHQEFTLSPHSTIGQQIGFRMRIKGPGSLEYAREKAKELKVSEEVLDILYALPDLEEEEKDKIMRQMQIAPDIYGKLFPKVTFEDVKEHATKIFESLDLPLDILYKTPYQISGGEHVRAYIALALTTRPEILMLDEPFGDLDPVTLRDVTNALKRINKEFGTTIIIVSHHMDFVKEVSHRAVLIDDAKVVNDGDPVEVSNQLIEMSHASYLERTMESLIAEK
ncbi:MAG: putative ABC transporter ATP-binding protein [Methanomethylovorans sp. PtaU1.Bin093]|uniref:ATP-binding cassette domain-containing protein n=1 Tax=Methanomethylovorans sp. PtaU1.Bin093 TaxID=1811679 RepID=UPI0009CB086B|nr:ATP-binding cassette domain-containing protein [Methanomethylovorans sp. PtaU1.Bin093]OPY18280.1 MAG: putative ABC transporter ATP-binding protein [Methanomethylovorans sp. PtaU1.Bin093]